MEVTVALVGDPDTGLIEEQEWQLPWGDRKHIELEIRAEESLASVVDRAFETFGVALPEHARSYSGAYPFVAFRNDDVGLRVSSSLDVVDETGRVIWNVYDFDTISFDQIRKSSAAGTISGDPSRLYVVLQPPSGNGILVDWPTLVEGWRIAWDVLERLATVAEVVGGAEVVRRVIRKLRRGSDSVARNRSAWTQRGGRPHDLARTLLQSEWTVDELAQVLGCSEDDAAALLEAFGFHEHDRVWTRADDADGRLLEAIRSELDYSHHMQHDGFEPLFRGRLESFIRSGERPPEEAYEYAPQQALLEVTAFGYSEQTVTFQAQLGEHQFAASLPLWELEEAVDITAIADRVVRSELRRLGTASSNDAVDE